MSNSLERDRRLLLELESSHQIAFFVNDLAQEFDRAKFILTIRDCYSWLDSMLNHQLRRARLARESLIWSKMFELYFDRGGWKHADGERVLAEQGCLYTVDGYLSFWQRHNTQVLAAVPRDRLFSVRTDRISNEATRIAEFLEIPTGTLDVSQSHLDRTRKKHGLLAKVDQGFLEEKVNLYCRELMDEFFPDISCFDDATQGQ